jgi:NitT/TauT family transport system substrate-binding protein
MRILRSLLVACSLLLASVIPGGAADKVRLATNWRAEAEHGGFYQALVDGTYERYGLDVTILPGGPQLNTRLLLAAGRVDFAIGANTVEMFDAVRQNTPIVTVASIFQIDPVVLLSHPGAGLDRLEDLPKATAFVASDFLVTAWRWLKMTHGFRDEKVKPYGFNTAPFLADKQSIQQGYLTSEPYSIERTGGFRPNIFLLPDYGYNGYASTIDTRADTIAKSPDLVQRFVDASIIGWYNYLYGDNTAANAMIRRDNPEMTDGQIAFSLAIMRERGVVDSGDALVYGIGAMSETRFRDFYEKMVKAGVIPAGLDFAKGYSLRFVGKKVGMEFKPRP